MQEHVRRARWACAAGLTALAAAGAACGAFGSDDGPLGPGGDGPDADASLSPDAPSGIEGGGKGGVGFADGQVIASGLSTLTGIACDEQAAYVLVESGQAVADVVRVAPGEGPRTIASGQYKARTPAVDDTRVFWATGDPGGAHSYIRATKKLAGGAVDSYFPDGNGAALFSALTIKGSVLAFHSSSSGGRIFRAATDGSGGADVATGHGPVAALAIEGAHVYWIGGNGSSIARASTASGGAAEAFAAGASMTALAVAAGEVLWTSDDGKLRALSTALPGGPPRDVASGLDLPRGLVAEPGRAYWVNTATGTIATVASAGGTPATIALAGGSATVAACGNALWFTKPASGEVIRVAKIAKN